MGETNFTCQAHLTCWPLCKRHVWSCVQKLLYKSCSKGTGLQQMVSTYHAAVDDMHPQAVDKDCGGHMGAHSMIGVTCAMTDIGVESHLSND